MPDQTDSPNNGKATDHTPRNISRSVSPIVPGRAGRPSYSLDALRELVERQFNEETAGRTDILLELDSEAKRRDLLSEIADYVLAAEAVTLSAADRHRVIDDAYANLFSFGPLDTLLRDDTVTEITLNGPYDIYVRHGMAAPQKSTITFEDVYHLETIVQRVLASAGRTLSETFLEVGVELYARRARLSIIGPPVRTGYSIEMRLHPARPLTLDNLRDDFATLDDTANTLLRAILNAGHGMLIVGDASIGKTTLASALIAGLAEHTPASKLAAAERAAENHLPPGAARFTPGANETFAAALTAALDAQPAWLIADEVRTDDATALWDALTRKNAPHYIWVFRGARQPDRLKSALGMLVRQHIPTLPQADINTALITHLPFVVALRRTGNTPRLATIAEWARDEADPTVLTLRSLLDDHEDGWRLTGTRSAHALDLPESFWGNA